MAQFKVLFPHFHGGTEENQSVTKNVFLPFIVNFYCFIFVYNKTFLRKMSGILQDFRTGDPRVDIRLAYCVGSQILFSVILTAGPGVACIDYHSWKKQVLLLYSWRHSSFFISFLATT
jgi:hypothetical protein